MNMASGFLSNLLASASLASTQGAIDHPAWLLKLRQNARKSLCDHVLPTLRDDDWKYTSLAELDRQPFSLSGSVAGAKSFVPPGAIDSTIYIVNGIPDLTRSTMPEGLEVHTGLSALDRLTPAQQEAFAGVFPNEHTSLTHLNLALFSIPVMIHCPAGQGPYHINCIHVYTAAAATCFFPRLCIVAGAGARLSYSELHHFETGSHFSGSMTDVFIADGATVEGLRASVHTHPAFQISSCRVHQGRDSVSRMFYYTRGGRLVRDNYSVFINGEGAQAVLHGLHELDGTDHADSHTYVEHAAPGSTSDQLYKSILGGESRSVFNGKILVRRDAQLTNSYQLNKNLLLSREARVDTKPQLEIMADNVKCTHGATIGQLSKDELFYLQTRGIGREDALKMLIRGFIDDVVGRVINPTLQRGCAAIMNR